MAALSPNKPQGITKSTQRMRMIAGKPFSPQKIQRDRVKNSNTESLKLSLANLLSKEQIVIESNNQTTNQTTESTESNNQTTETTGSTTITVQITPETPLICTKSFHDEPKLILFVDTPMNITLPANFKVDIGHNTFVAVTQWNDDYFNLRACSTLVRNSPLLGKITLVRGTKVRIDNVQMILDEDIKIELPDMFPIKILPQTRLQQLYNVHARFILDTECVCYVILKENRFSTFKRF